MNHELVGNQQIQLTVGTLENVTRSVVELHIIAVKATSLLESSPLIVKQTVHGLQRSFQLAFVSRKTVIPFASLVITLVSFYFSIQSFNLRIEFMLDAP